MPPLFFRDKPEEKLSAADLQYERNLYLSLLADLDAIMTMHYTPEDLPSLQEVIHQMGRKHVQVNMLK